MRKQIFAFIMAVAVIGCSNHDVEPAERPGDNGSNEVETPDYSLELADSDLRFVCDTLAMRFSEGGIMYIADGDVHRFIDLDSPRTIVFDHQNRTLLVNGRYAPVEELEVIGRGNGLKWISVKPEGQILVVEE